MPNESQPPQTSSTTSSTPVPSTQPQTSPLAEAKATSLEELFSRDPFEFTQQDEEAIVTELRKQRANWEAAEKAGTSPAAKARATKAAGKETVSLGDLGL
jgi:hypothetical protein